MQDVVDLVVGAFRRTTYTQWQKAQGIPIVEGFGLKDVREVEMKR